MIDDDIPEPLRLAKELRNALELIHCGFPEDIDEDELRMAAGELETLHARTQELEKDLGNAKALVSKIWSQHPEARDTIERGTGAWFVFGMDVEAGSAQRITQQSDGIRSCQTPLGKAPEPKAIGGCKDGTTLADIDAHFSAVKATTTQERDKFEQVMAASHPHLSFDRHSYGHDHDRFAQYKVQWLWGGWLARAALEVKDRIAQARKMVAPVVLPEPAAYRLTNTTFRKPRYEYHDTRQAAEQRQADFNSSVDDGGLYGLTPLYTEQQVRELLAGVSAPQQQQQQAHARAAWSGWACQYPGKMPRLYGAREIAELNCDAENGDQLLFLSECTAPQPQEDARDNLLAALENLLASITGGQKQCGHEFDCVCPEVQARAAIAAQEGGAV